MHIDDMHILKLDPEGEHPCPWGSPCTIELFSPSDLAEHLRTKHSIRLTGNGTSKKSYAPLNGNLSRLLSDYRGNYAKEETGHNSELTDDSAQPLRKRRKPPSFKVLGLPYSTAGVPVEKRREELRSYHAAPKTSYACLRMFNKSALRQRCQEEGVSVSAKDTQDGLARKLSAHVGI
ncbi:hypothetical protein IAS59_005488 [Cryptococcus gattii]